MILAILRIAVIAAIVVLLGAALFVDARGLASLVAAGVLVLGLLAPEMLT